MRNLPASVGDACACARWNTFKQIFALSAKYCVSGLMDNLLSINEHFFFVSCAVTIDKVPF